MQEKEMGADRKDACGTKRNARDTKDMFFSFYLASFM